MEYALKLEGGTKVRTIDELNQLLNYMIEIEEYELCSKIKYIIDNYDELLEVPLVKELNICGI